MTNTQYLRWECLDIIGIPREVKADVLEEDVVNIIEKLGCNIPSNCMKACHRLSEKSATVIAKFSRRKDCQQFFCEKGSAQNKNGRMEDIDLPGQN